jgi:heptosyltransferase I
MNPMPKLLLVRLDRIGDLALTLPVDQNIPYSAQWWIPSGLSFVSDSAQPPRKAREIKKQFRFREFFSLWRDLRKEKIAAAVVFHAPWWIGLLLFATRIPLRAGVLSQWHSFLFFNRGIRQKRSQAECSELEYNYRLIEEALGLQPLLRASLHLHHSAKATLGRFSLQTKTYFVVHPGMGNSALNWPEANYVQLIAKLAEKSTVAITGTPNDELHLRKIRSSFSNHPKVKILIGQLNGFELIEILENASGVFAPSTGVLHLAAATGVATVGVFSPVRVQSARRWGPQGAQTLTLTPAVDCPGVRRCLGPACPHFNCMELISPTEAEARLLQLVNK